VGFAVPAGGDRQYVGESGSPPAGLQRQGEVRGRRGWPRYAWGVCGRGGGRCVYTRPGGGVPYAGGWGVATAGEGLGGVGFAGLAVVWLDRAVVGGGEGCGIDKAVLRDSPMPHRLKPLATPCPS